VVSRRQFLRNTIAASLALAGGAFATACAQPAAPAATPTQAPAAATSAPAATQAPKPAATAAATTAAAATNVATAPTPAKGGVLKVGKASDFTGFDPTNFGTFQQWIPQFYDTLIRQDAALKPSPELAESWQMSTDGRQLTMNLRKGVLFHNGRELEAKDVAFTVKRTADPAIAANIRGMLTPIKSVDVKDKYTAVFNFDRPYAAIFDALDLMYIHPEEEANNLKTKPVGTGPFTLGQWVPNTTVQLKRNVKYWKTDAPLVDEIQVVILPDAQGRIVAMETGSVDVAESPSYVDYVRILDEKKYRVYVAGLGATMMTVYFNVTRQPFNNKKVRQAFSLALDRARITSVYTRGVSEPQCLPWRKEVFAYDAELAKRCDFNLDKAKALLAEAGLPNGAADINISGEGYSPGSKVTAEVFQADLAKIGFKLTIKEYEAAAARPKLTTGDFQVAAHGYGRANRDPATLFGGALPFYNKSDITKFESPDYDRLISEGASTMDQAKRKDIYRQLTEIILDECHVLTICPRPERYAFRANVKGFATNLEGMMDLRGVSVTG
jgi:peptide/nickel transport system substrate-binding protein